MMPFDDNDDYAFGADEEPGEAAELLGKIETFLRRFVRFDNDAQVIAVTLWVAHTYVIDAADCTPYLSIRSAEKRSGKTLLLEVLELLACNPVTAASMTAAVMFRMIGAGQPTILFDEIDTVFRQTKGGDDSNELLRGVINAGYRKSGRVYRMVGVGQKMRPVAFPVFCAKALAGIGQLPDTIADRSIPIVMKRKLKAEPVERFRRREVMADAERLSEWLAGWGDPALVKQLASARPTLPDVLDDRAQDIWEPLLAIADHAGNDWPERARAAAQLLHAAQLTEDSVSVLLLRHIREVFNDTELERLPTDTLLGRIIERDDGPWAGWWERDVRTAAINNVPAKGPAARLARLLARFEIKPTKFKTGSGNATARGYVRADFVDAWARYLDAEPVPSEGDLETEPGNGAGQSATDVEPEGWEVPSLQASDQGGSEVPSFTPEHAQWPRMPGLDDRFGDIRLDPVVFPPDAI